MAVAGPRFRLRFKQPELAKREDVIPASVPTAAQQYDGLAWGYVHRDVVGVTAVEPPKDSHCPTKAPYVAVAEAEQAAAAAAVPTPLSDSLLDEEQTSAGEMPAATDATQLNSKRTVATEAQRSAADVHQIVQERRAPTEPEETNVEVTRLHPQGHDERDCASDVESALMDRPRKFAAAVAEDKRAAAGASQIAGHVAAEASAVAPVDDSEASPPKVRQNLIAKFFAAENVAQAADEDAAETEGGAEVFALGSTTVNKTEGPRAVPSGAGSTDVAAPSTPALRAGSARNKPSDEVTAFRHRDAAVKETLEFVLDAVSHKDHLRVDGQGGETAESRLTMILDAIEMLSRSARPHSANQISPKPPSWLAVEPYRFEPSAKRRRIHQRDESCDR